MCGPRWVLEVGVGEWRFAAGKGAGGNHDTICVTLDVCGILAHSFLANVDHLLFQLIQRTRFHEDLKGLINANDWSFACRR